MTTRNEWIAETARMFRIHGIMDADHRRKWLKDRVGAAKELANDLESANVAPWHTPTPSVEAEAVALLRQWLDGSAGARTAVAARALLAKIDGAKS